MAAPVRDDEDASLAALRQLQVLDSAPEAEFDALVRIASSICGVPISLISLIDTDRQWFKANVGLPGVEQTPREHAFCAHAVLGDDIFEVEDAAQDARFADNPLVLGQPDIRFYAGAPVTLRGGERIGTLCVIDRVPGKLSAQQRLVLHELAVAAAKLLEGRLAMREYVASVQAAAAVQKDLSLVLDNVPAMIAYWNADLTCRYANPAYRDWFGVDPRRLIGKHISELLGPALFVWNKPYLDAALRGLPQTFERVVQRPDGVDRHALAHYVPDVVDGQVVGLLVHMSDVTSLKIAEEALRIEMAARERVHDLLLTRTAELDKAQQLGGIGSWSWEVEDDRVTWSAELFRILGCDPAAGPPSLAEQARLYTPDSYARLQASVAKALDTGEVSPLDLAFVRPDGAVGWLEARGETVTDAEGRIVRIRGTVQDITERRRAQDELARQHELMRVTLQSIGDAVITTDAAGAVAWLNPVAEQMTGWPAAEARGRPLTQVFNIVNEETRAVTENPVTTCLAQGRIVGLANHTLLISRDGTEFGIEDSAAPIRNAAGEVLGVVLVFHDVSEQRRMSGEMTYRATHDTLTGLVNRAEFEARLLRLLCKCHEEDGLHAMLYIDLDQFKLVNDACGHAIGDQLLQQMGKLLAETVRTRDTLARLGGDEFAIILEHCSVEQANHVAQKICDRMNEFRFIHEDRRFRIGTSIGLVPVDKRWASIAAIQQAADTSCYAAKEAGRNRVHTWFDTDLAMRARQFEMQWTSRIERALDEDGFVLFAQRIRPLRSTGGGVRAEVLLRMKNEDGTLALPGAFLPAAERFHLASRVDRWVLWQAVSWLSKLPQLDAIATLSVNLSGQSVGDRAFHGWAREMLAKAGGEVCARLCLEITETATVTNLADAAVFIEAVRSQGVKVSLDDFGAGASSFGYLKSLPVDYLKIDGQFIRDLIDDPLDEAAVRCFTEVAQVVGVDTVAEFVESPDVLERLRMLGVDHAQGFLIHRPEPIDALLQEVPVEVP
jgi:diguanylate cyclase